MNLSEYAKTLGRRGGLARARRLSSDQKKEIASLGAKSRVASLKMAKRITVNFRYFEALCELKPLPKVRCLKRFHEKVAGVYG